MKKNTVIIGTRSSKLALWQANYIKECIGKQYPELTVSLVQIMTTGDKILDVPLAKIGGKGLFTKEIETAMLNGEIDLAVHCLKDMPTQLPVGLGLVAITQRLDAGDALISPQYGTIDKLPQGAKVGTSSLRRKAQLLRYRPDLQIRDLRGNLDTRLKKMEVEGLDGIILAVAGLKRLGWEKLITQILPHDICLPAVGQGALAIQTRTDDVEIGAILEFLDHQETRWAVEAERAYLAEVEGGCQIPLGVYGAMQGDLLVLDAIISSIDGTQHISQSISGQPAAGVELGRTLARRMLAAGGREMLEKLTMSD